MEAARNSVNLNRKASAESPYAPIEKPLLNWYLGLRRVNQTVTGTMVYTLLANYSICSFFHDLSKNWDVIDFIVCPLFVQEQ